ncbi:toll-like receptor 10 isoform X2 [Suricata suricatta]|uniref:toll-like receptor 10 isoform X2 n=1 Tax=Suricata suricatta TaxID=37032 RepID=UPI001155D757|nr:toll-like receptor 10 isoform X2 [Suricata suricatta]
MTPSLREPSCCCHQPKDIWSHKDRNHSVYFCFRPSTYMEKEEQLTCLHEENFDPGKSITENIMNCIEKSCKSIFVLSPNFVQSEWYHYELYFAHNRFQENFDDITFILLEPIPLCCIPTKYPKLKALMEKKAYLEWPKDRHKCGLFWANL